MALNVVNSFSSRTGSTSFSDLLKNDICVIFLVSNRSLSKLNQSSTDSFMTTQGFVKLYSCLVGTNDYTGAFTIASSGTGAITVKIPDGINGTGYRIRDGYISSSSGATTSLPSSVSVGSIPTYIIGVAGVVNLVAVSGFNLYHTHWSYNSYMSNAARTGSFSVPYNKSNNGEIRLLIQERVANKSPTQPGVISGINSSLYLTKESLSISWGKSTDPDGDAITYKVDIFNGKSWVNLKQGITGVSETITFPSGIHTNSAKLRVTAVDSKGNSSTTRESNVFQLYKYLVVVKESGNFKTFKNGSWQSI